MGIDGNKSWRRRLVQTCLFALITVLTASCSLQPFAGSKDNVTKSDGPAVIPELSFMLVLNRNDSPADTIIPELQRLTNTKLTFTWVPDNIYTDKMISAITSGTLPKAVQVKAVDVKHPSVVNSVRSGLFWEIGPYLKDFPLMSKFANPIIMNNASYFGKTYGIYWERPRSRQGIQYRKDWLERLHLAEPKSINDMYEVLKAFTYRDPDGNGKQDTYGLIDRNDLVYGAFDNLASYFGAPNNWGLDADGKLIPDFMTVEYRDTMKFMKKLYDEKLINTDFTITSKVQQEERFVQGEAGMMISNIVYSSVRNRLQKMNKAAEVEITNRIQGPKGERIWGGSGFGGLFLFPKSSIKTESELREVLSFFEKLLSEDANNLITYGLPDRHYKLNENKSVKVFPDTQSIREQEVEPYTNALRTFDIRYLQLGELSEQQEKTQRMIDDTTNIVVNDPTTALFSPTQAEKGSELHSIITDATYQFILGKIDELGFSKEVDKWRQNGGNQIIQELNQEYAQINK
ncbi:hypothetical protein ASG89_02065 [Paenibacillus sp. Soil766]|uniref:extracellular solute-binding protein n=1 Tax=Paenibacillus sp. Soil766 TaxID=1736404 RepID=UPI000709D365|nr:extracellular solute-binding protein [Paenibacillus sp. Soil766]KRF03577.1 hypothetical protein ASG89_02065 [Paenibacillus sp. Soil766]